MSRPLLSKQNPQNMTYQHSGGHKPHKRLRLLTEAGQYSQGSISHGKQHGLRIANKHHEPWYHRPQSIEGKVYVLLWSVIFPLTYTEWKPGNNRPNCKPGFFPDLIINSIFPSHGIPYDTIDTILSLAFPSHGIPYDTIDLILNPAFAIHGLPYEIIHIIISPAFPRHGISYAANINPEIPLVILHLQIHERLIHISSDVRRTTISKKSIS